MINRSTTITTMNGATDRTNLSYETSAMPFTTKRSNPTGGVMSPMDRLTTMMRPKKMGSIPAAKAIGNNSGVNMVIAADAFRKHPAIKNMTVNISRTR